MQIIRTIGILALAGLATASTINAQPNLLFQNNSIDSLSLIQGAMNSVNSPTSGQQQTIDAVQQISNGSEQFSLEFLKLLSRAVTAFNYDFIISPFSIWSMLVLQAEGAAGNTYDQLQKVLRLPEDLNYLRMAYKHVQKALNVNTSTVEVDVNQVLFTDINRPVDIEYSYKLDNIYEADHIPVNFHNTVETFNKINQYVSDQTRGKIPRIVNMDDLREAQMVLISAIFFKGQWKVGSHNKQFSTFTNIFYLLSFSFFKF